MKILLAVDDSKYSQAAVRAVITQFRPEGSSVEVLNVIEPIDGYISADMFPHFTPQVLEVEQERQKQGKAMVERVARELQAAGFQTTAFVDVGTAKARIIDRARKLHADLIVVGSHGLTGLNRFLMGSVSEAVSHHAECSVEVVRIPAAEVAAAPEI